MGGIYLHLGGKEYNVLDFEVVKSQVIDMVILQILNNERISDKKMMMKYF